MALIDLNLLTSFSFWLGSVLLFGSLLAAYLASRIEKTAIKILVALLLIIMVSTGAAIRQGEGVRSAKLPNVKGLCKGNLQFSWKVPKKKVLVFKDALQDDAKCSAPIDQIATPSPFPPYR